MSTVKRRQKVYFVRGRCVTCRWSQRSQWNKRSVGLWAHADTALAADVIRRRVVSGTDVHRSVSVLRQPRLRHVQRNLQRAVAVQQSTAARLNSPQTQTGSARHCLRLRKLFDRVKRKNDDNWYSGCLQQHCRASRTVSAARLVLLNIFQSFNGRCFLYADYDLYTAWIIGLFPGRVFKQS